MAKPLDPKEVVTVQELAVSNMLEIEALKKIGDMLYSSCQEKNERLRNINDYNMIDNTPFRKHTYP